VGPEDAEPLTFAGGGADGVGGRAVGVPGGAGPGADVGEGGLVLGPDGDGEELAGRWVDVEGGEALLGIAAVEFQVGVGQGIEQGSVLGPQGPLLGHHVGQRLARRGSPGAEGGDELVTGDHAVLEGEQAKEEIAGRVVASRHGGSLPAPRRAAYANARPLDPALGRASGAAWIINGFSTDVENFWSAGGSPPYDLILIASAAAAASTPASTRGEGSGTAARYWPGVLGGV
jgi:hypothetical protein